MQVHLVVEEVLGQIQGQSEEGKQGLAQRDGSMTDGIGSGSGARRDKTY